MTGELLNLFGGNVLIVRLLQLALIVVLAWLAVRTVSLFGKHLEQRMERAESDPGRRARLSTLLHTGLQTVIVVITIAAGLMALTALGINVAPILAGAGLVGLAVSLGAQTLIKDFIGGVLILVENQFYVGDEIQAGIARGTVENITLRATYLRDYDGKLWIIPNGDVRIINNATRDWSRAVVDINLPTGVDMARALAALQAAMQQVSVDQSVAGGLLEAPQVQGWTNLTDTTVQVRLTAKTAPGKQWDVARIMRQYALAALREAGLQGASPVNA
jgi:small conductance mechanosensitive channel